MTDATSPQATRIEAASRAATARVETPNAARYLKALCNHFDRKADAGYEGTRGHATFPFGTCEMEARPDALLLRIAAEDDTMFDRVRYVVEDHLVRFGAKEGLQVEWVEA